MKSKYIIVGIGELLWDMLPEGKQFGGAPCNFAFHAKQSGAQVYIVSAVGDDDLGDELLDVIADIDLSLRYIQKKKDVPTSVVDVQLDAGGSPNYNIKESVAWDNIEWSEQLEELARSVDAVCFGSLSQRSAVSRRTIMNFLDATKEDCLRVFDVNLRQHYYDKDILLASLSRANILKLNEDELPVLAKILGYECADALSSLMNNFDLKLLVYTKGSKGSVLYSPDEVSELAIPKVEVVDTVGAGDSFTSMVVCGLLNGEDLEVIHKTASRLSSYVCAQRGATPSVPKEIYKFIKPDIMRRFNYHQSTEIVFGAGRIEELAGIVKRYGGRALLVTTPATIPALKEQYDRVINILHAGGVEVAHYDGVIPNPTIDSVQKGVEMAKKEAVDVIVGLGGGSSMDTAKAISVGATHPGTCWDYLFYKTPQPDEKKLLPIIAISTTSGTGSHVTQVAVVTNPETKDKSALYNNILYPKVAIVDAELMTTLPPFITATTGFDALCHCFESAINVNNNGAYVQLLAWEGISIVAEYLPKVLKDPANVEYREKMAWADTLGGLSIAVAGVTLPHGMGMAIGGLYPNVAHGEGLAILYPAFANYTWKYDVPAFARLARLLNPELESVSEDAAAQFCSEALVAFIKKIGIYRKLKDVGMPFEEVGQLAKQCMVLPDYKNNPKVATLDEMVGLVRESY